MDKAPAKTVFDLLEDVRRCPTMYVGFDETERHRQLQHLDSIVEGYAIALRHHGIQEPVQEFRKEFAAFLQNKTGLSMSCGPIEALYRAAKSGEDEWDLFWKFFDEFADLHQNSSGHRE